jgi:hypothetical protein
MRYGRSLTALVLLATALLRADLATAQERALSFANLRFGAAPATVLDVMKGLKLTPIVSAPDHQFPLDQRFEGELKGKPVLVSALYDPSGHLEKVMIAFLTADEDCVPLYRSLKHELRAEYGTPIVDVERWDYPYNNGGHVGQEHFAIRIGRGLLATAWDRDDAGTRDGGVSLMTSESVIVRLAYESSLWAAESERRKRILASTTEGLADETARAPREDGASRISGTR